MADHRIPIRSGPLRGFRYTDVGAAAIEEAGGWLSRGAVPEAREIKPGRVFVRNGLLVKLWGPGHPLKDRFRPSPAVRAADLHRRLLPIRTPRPHLALELRRGRLLLRSLLLCELVEGSSLIEAAERDPSSLEALPAFLASMRLRGRYHGDLHSANLIWNGSEWVLIDLESMRHPLRCLLPRRLIVKHWARIRMDLHDAPVLRTLFEAYLGLAGLRWDPERAWEQVHRRARRMAAVRGRKLA